MTTFPEVDPADVAQAIKTNSSANQDINCAANGGTANSLALFSAVASAVTVTQNVSNDYFEASIQSEVNTNTILFFNNTTLLPGQWVYQVSADVVDLASSAFSYKGPTIGVVLSSPTPTTVLVQVSGSFLYTPNQYSFIPLTADTTYYLGSDGEITSAPNPGSGGYVQEVGFSKNAEQFIIGIRGVTLV